MGVRVAKHAHICAYLLNFKNKSWLMHMRAQWVPFNSDFSRNSLTAGRTATRCNVGRPQVRWEDGYLIAKDVLESRDLGLKGQNALGIAARIRNLI